MSMKRALQAILVVSVVGVTFSGTLLYREACHQLIEACTLGVTTGEAANAGSSTIRCGVTAVRASRAGKGSDTASGGMPGR